MFKGAVWQQGRFVKVLKLILIFLQEPLCGYNVFCGRPHSQQFVEPVYIRTLQPDMTHFNKPKVQLYHACTSCHVIIFMTLTGPGVIELYESPSFLRVMVSERFFPYLLLSSVCFTLLGRKQKHSV